MADDVQDPVHPTVWLTHAQQRLGVLPRLGGGVAAWQWLRPQGAFDLWRPWNGERPDRYTLASFPLVPWSNRISGGGFEHAGQFHAIVPNRPGEPYPIHGDGWLQPWTCSRTAPDTLVMSLESHRFDGSPYVYAAEQRFTLVDGGMDQQLSVTNRGEESLPYGLGQHPYFLRGEGTRLQAGVRGLWLSGDDPLPTEHTTSFPPGWDLNDAPAHGSMIDHCYTGWSGDARIEWPHAGVRLTMQVPGEHDGYCLLYRPPVGEAIAFEPITHPIDAFHLPGRPGLRVLQPGQGMSLQVRWRFGDL